MTTEKKPGYPLFITTLVLIALFLFVYAFISVKDEILQDSANTYARAIGYSMAPAILLWIVYYFAYLRKRFASPQYILSFVVFFLAAVCGGVLRTQLYHSGTQQQKYEMTKRVNLLIDSLNKVKGEIVLDNNPQTVDDLLKAIITRFAQIGRRRDAALDSVGFYTLLDPERLKKDKKLLESDKILRDAQDINKMVNAEFLKVYDASIKDIEGLNASESDKKDFLKGFKNGYDQEKIKRANSLMEKSLYYHERIIQVFKRTKGWTLLNDMLVFEDEKSQIEYNTYIDSLQMLTPTQI